MSNKLIQKIGIKIDIKIDIKNQTCYYFDDIIHINDIDLDSTY